MGVGSQSPWNCCPHFLTVLEDGTGPNDLLGGHLSSKSLDNDQLLSSRAVT